MGDSGGRVRLIQFARAPRAGRVKTRMIPHLSAEQACELHCALVLWTCERLVSSGLGEVELSVAGDPTSPLFRRCCQAGANLCTRQNGGDLGERMFHAISRGLLSSDKVILVGSDCPDIDTEYLAAAIDSLADSPLVFGPAVDGGYVLIGARQIQKEVFEGVDWGTGLVLAQTRDIMRQRGLAWSELPALTDIDRPEDLPVWDTIKLTGP